MAISELDMKPEEMKKILDMQDERDISRRLFLLAESISAGRIFLNLFNGARRFGSVSDVWMINNFWKTISRFLNTGQRFLPTITNHGKFGVGHCGMRV